MESSGGSYSSGVIYDSAPTYSTPAPAAAAPAVNSSYYGAPAGSGSFLSTMNSTVSSDEIHLMVYVPEAARVYVNGNATTSTGTSRHFVSRGLEAGNSYRFDVRVELDVNGKAVSESKSVVLVPGRDETLSFAMESTGVSQKETVLTLNVPADAHVVLAGNPTKSTDKLVHIARVNSSKAKFGMTTRSWSPITESSKKRPFA